MQRINNYIQACISNFDFFSDFPIGDSQSTKYNISDIFALK